MDKSSELELIESYDVPEEGKGFLRDCVLQGPSRSVLSGGTRSVVGAHFSSKLRETRQFESRSSEAAVLLMLDADSSVLSYHTQLPRVEFPSTNKAGRNYVQRYTADALILRSDRPEIAEIKTSKDLAKLAVERPHQWLFESDGDARFMPAEKHFTSWGLDYSVINSSLIPAVLVMNTKLLLRVVHTIPSPSDTLLTDVRATLEKHAWMSICDLQEELSLSRIDDILHMVAQGQIFAELKFQKLSAPETILSMCPTVLRRAIEQQTLPSAPTLTGHRAPSLMEARKAVENLKIAKEGNSRQARRMRQKIKEGALVGLNPFESVLPRISNRGNRTRRLAESQEQFLIEHQEKSVLTGKHESIGAAYNNYKNELADADHAFPPVSVATYYRFAKQLDRQTITSAIHGKKAGNAVSKVVDSEHATPAATRAFERALVDHTLVKVLLVVALNDEYAIVRRPWLTSLVDEFSGATLAQWLSFGNPSRESICMLLRMCILRHGRIPEEIHSDRGSDFTSWHTQEVMARLGVTRQYSPVASPKYNSQAERHFSETQAGLFKKLPGNIIEYKNRKTDRAHHPKIKAIFDPITFYRLLFAYAEAYNNGIHGCHEAQPNYLLRNSLREIESSGIITTLTDDVYLATCIPVESKWGPRARRSLLIDGRHYYSECLTPRTTKKDLCIRFDPWHCEVIYIQKQGQWYTATRRTGRTTFTGADISRQLGESLRIMMCRRDRDLLKAGQTQKAAKIIDDAIEHAKTTQMATATPQDGRDDSTRNELEERFARLKNDRTSQPVVEWD